MTDREYMLRAIELAKKGSGFVNPNPAVGAVIVKNGKIIGEGHHHAYGSLHAERDAFTKLTESAEGATIYVTLEPCCHFGKQPPCTEVVIENKIAKVVIGSRDPNPKVSGKGCKQLREQGIEVIEDFMREECDEINDAFFHYIQTGRPYVVMKYAMTIDGKIATRTGASKWITGDVAREHVHRTRAKYSAIMAGIGTVLVDDPMLNVRLEGEEQHQPVRIIVDSNLRIPLESNIVKTAGEYRTVIAYSEKDSAMTEMVNETADDTYHENNCSYGNSQSIESNQLIETNQLIDKKLALEKAGIELICCPGENGQVDLVKVMDWASEQRLDSVFIEGGGQIHEAAMKVGIVNHVMAYIAPKIFGGADAKTPVEGEGVEMPVDCMGLTFTRMTQLGEDILLEYDVKEAAKIVYRNR